jgi:acetylglutamate kinase
VGEVRHVTPDVVVELMRAGFIPVIAPIGVDEHGASLNLNADTAAGKVAEALRAEKLILLTDVEGVRGADGGFLPARSTRHRRGSHRRPRHRRRDDPEGGVRPRSHRRRRAQGAHRRRPQAHAVLLEIFTNDGVGTEIVRA